MPLSINLFYTSISREKYSCVHPVDINKIVPRLVKELITQPTFAPPQPAPSSSPP